MKTDSLHAPLIGLLRLNAGNIRRTAPPHGQLEALQWAGGMMLAADALEEVTRELEAAREVIAKGLRVGADDDEEPAPDVEAPKKPRRGRPPKAEPAPLPVVTAEDAAVAGIAAASAPVVTP